MIWLLDSVTIIYALNGQGRCRQHLNCAPTRGRVATSILAVAEVYYGVENSRRREENLQRVDSNIANWSERTGRKVTSDRPLLVPIRSQNPQY